MNADELRAAGAVMLAAAEGKRFRYRWRPGIMPDPTWTAWMKAGEHRFHFGNYVYEVEPEPSYEQLVSENAELKREANRQTRAHEDWKRRAQYETRKADHYEAQVKGIKPFTETLSD